MKDLEQARSLLCMAEKDFRALCGMEDSEVFSPEIFGFHVQQAVEKTLKAWLCALGVAFPRIHDLDELAALLEEAGQSVPPAFAALLDFSDFAVAFRYDAFPDFEGEMDRQDCCRLVRGLLDHVRTIVAHCS
ncbi:MAG: HEPN domain-containing protein [Sedimentisphaerales bacterium]|nr:HEPN domain-containing protein [Sedimentisphaerales bacterium]